MKEKRLRPSDVEWNQRKAESHLLNEALRDGFVDGRMFRRGIMARKILEPYLNKNAEPRD